jgi:hypothetical protein
MAVFIIIYLALSSKSHLLDPQILHENSAPQVAKIQNSGQNSRPCYQFNGIDRHISDFRATPSHPHAYTVRTRAHLS